MTIDIGTRKVSEKDGSWSEIRLFGTDFSECAVVVRNSLIENVSVTESASGIPHCEATLQGPRFSADPFHRGAGVEIWFSTPHDVDPVLMIRGKIDYVEVRYDSTKDSVQLQFQARSAISDLVDGGFCEEHEGPLAELVQRMCKPHHADVDTPPIHMRTYVCAASSYAALQLLAVSLSSVVSVGRDASITFRDKVRERKRISAQAPVSINLSESGGFHVQDGRPFRR